MHRQDGSLLPNTEHIKQSVATLLATAPGERVMRPTYGCALASYIDAPINSDTILDMQIAIRDAVATFEPRATIDSIAFDAINGKQGMLNITIAGNFGIATIAI
ncbi:MAG: GPW/gp25 family protein [Alphaproteobacteria bacterium]|nr:GPW/gp25 family protein [Alphaproteobacteria bacterium]